MVVVVVVVVVVVAVVVVYVVHVVVATNKLGSDNENQEECRSNTR